MPVALSSSGEWITCHGCRAPVEEVTEDMKALPPDGLYRPGAVFITCRPVPGLVSCLTLAHREVAEHLRDCHTCQDDLGPALTLAIITELLESS